MDIGNLRAVASFARQIEQWAEDARRDLASGDTESAVEILTRISENASLAAGGADSVGASLRRLAGG